MGIEVNINHDKFPLQGTFLGTAVLVTFMYDTKRTLKGTVVRDDAEAPGVMIIKLDNGNHVLATECQWQPVPKPEVISFHVERTFTSDMIRQPYGAPMGIYEATIIVCVQEGGHSYAEFSIEVLDYSADIGLWFERTDEGLTLTDYDGTHCLPVQIIEVLREHDIIVTKDFE